VTIHQREIVEVNFRLPGGEYLPHPVIVLSNDAVNDFEEGFIGVMLSTRVQDDDFSFHLTEDMLTHKPRNKGQVRCHLIALLDDIEVTGKFGMIKQKYFEHLIDKIFEIVFLKSNDS